MWKFGPIGLALAIVFVTSVTKAAEPLTLREALSVAYGTNPQLSGQRAALRATDEGVAQADAGWRPTINFQSSYGFQRTHISGNSLFGPPATQNNNPLSGGLVFSQPIFRGGRTTAEIGMAKSQVRAGRAQLIDVEEGVLLNAVTAYMDVVRDAAIVNLKSENIAALRKQLDATLQEFKVGEVTRTDVSQAEARLSDAQADQATSVGQLRNSRSNFEHFVGRPAIVLEEEPAFPALPASEQAAIYQSLSNNPELLSAKELERAADYSVDDAAGVLMPQVSIQGQYQYQHDQPNTGQGFGIGQSEHITAVVGQLTIPLYQGGAEDSAVRQAEQRDAQAKLNIAEAQRQVVDAAKTAWDNYTAAEIAVASSKAAEQSNLVALDSVRQEQQIGSRTILDVLNATQELLNSQVGVVSAQRDARVAAFQILSATGKLTARDLGLAVKLYDPKQYYDENHARWFGMDDE